VHVCCDLSLWLRSWGFQNENFFLIAVYFWILANVSLITWSVLNIGLVFVGRKVCLELQLLKFATVGLAVMLMLMLIFISCKSVLSFHLVNTVIVFNRGIGISLP